MNMKRAIDASGGGTFMAGSTGGMLKGASLRAGGAAATATVREVDGSGAIIAVLGAGIGLTDHLPEGGIPFRDALHVTFTGTVDKFLLYV